MRELILVRHAKAVESPPPGGSDADRVLSHRGLRQLDELPRMLAPCRTPPGLVLASVAQRTRQTAAGLLAALPAWTCEARYEEGLYLATAEELLARLAALPDKIHSVCVVGHNAGLPELAERLTGTDVPMPTLGVVALASPAPRWRDLADSAASVLWRAVPGV